MRVSRAGIEPAHCQAGQGEGARRPRWSVVQVLDEVVEVIEERVVMLFVLGHEIPELALDGPQCLQAFSLGHVLLSRC